MKVISLADIKETEREVHCPKGGFTSFRFLLAKDGMGFSMHKTVIPKGDTQHWHYKNHLEACYCIAGAGILQNLETGEKHWIFPDTVYVLDNHDDHEFQAIEETILISVFNPPVTGGEVHDADGSYRKPLSQVVSEAEAFLGHEHMSPQAEEIKKIKKLAEDNGFTFAQVYDGLMTEEES